LICFPGGYLCVKTSLVLQNGGFDNLNDFSQLFKFAIHGVSGFNKKAKLYWRHHEMQTNKIQKAMGLIYHKNFKDWYDNYKIFDLHNRLHGLIFAINFQTYYNKFVNDMVIDGVYESIFFGGLKLYIKALKNLYKENANSKLKQNIILSIPKTIFKYFYSKIYFQSYIPRAIKNRFKCIKNFIYK